MSRFATRTVAAVFAIFLVSPALAAPPDPNEYTHAVALGCYFPIPAHYYFNTREREHFTWYSLELLETGRINIIDGNNTPLENYDVLEQRQESHLTILRLRYKQREGGPILPAPLNEVVVIANADQRAMLHGDAKAHEAYMVATCLANPAP